MLALTLLLVAAGTALAAARATGLPAVPCYLLAGLLLAAAAPVEGPVLTDLLMLGATVMTFVAGSELNPGRVRGQRRAALRVGAVQFGALAATAALMGRAWGLDGEATAYLALAVAASSTLVGVRLLRLRRQLFDAHGRLVVGVLLLQDLAVVLAIPLVAGASEGVAGVAEGLADTLLLVALAGALHRWGTPWLVKDPGEAEEARLLTVLGVLTAFLGLALALGVPPVSAAFLAGVALSRFPVGSIVRAPLEPMSDFFSALFFTALGAVVGVPGPTVVLRALAVAALVILLTPPLVAAVAERAGLSARNAVTAGLLLAQTSELSLIVGLQGAALGRIDQSVFAVIALATVLTMMATPLLAADRVTWWLTRFHPARRRPGLAGRPEGHVLLLGCGANGEAVLDLLILEGCRVVVVDEDPTVVRAVAEAGPTVVRGDAADPVTVEALAPERARAVVSTLNRVGDNRAVLERTGGRVPVLVRTFEPAEDEWVRSLGGTPVSFSAATADDFLAWFDEEADAPRGGGSPAAP